MNTFQRLVGIVLLLFLSFWYGKTPVTADANFATSLATTYVVNQQGTTTITHKFKITNRTPSLFVKQYALKISSLDVSQVSVTSNGQKIQPNVVSTDNQTSIALTFPDTLVGEGKTREVVISYLDKNAALVTGKVLELHVPKLSSADVYDQYSVTLITPSEFGQPVRISPTPTSTFQEGNQLYTTFSQVHTQGISALFGDQQVFDVHLTYHLQNPTSGKVLTQLALPPDTPFQKMTYADLAPLPTAIEPDTDGNWIATYQLEPNSTATVQLQAQALLTLTANPSITTTPPTAALLAAQPYWPTSDPQIQKLAQENPTIADTYQVVVDTLQYDFAGLSQQPERLGAEVALANPTRATCQEFTDVFVTLARAQGTPARRITGYAYNQDSSLRPLSLVEDILHAWPEYFDADQKIWVPVDPTWENTTHGVDYFHQFDLNHIVFAINGSSSTLPFPAGAYKLDRQNSKDVDVSFSQTNPITTPQFSSRLQPVTFLGFPIPGLYTLEISNQTGQAWYNLNLSLQSDQENVQLQLGSQLPPFHVTPDTAQQTKDIILPFQTWRLPLAVYTNHWLSFAQDQGSLKLDQSDGQNLHANHQLTFQPFFISPALIIVALSVGSCGIIATLITGSVLVFRRSK